MDEIDDAQLYNELHQAVSLANQLAKGGPEHDDRFDGTHCVACGGIMPPERLEAQRVRCFDCQSIVEYKAKQFVQS